MDKEKQKVLSQFNLITFTFVFIGGALCQRKRFSIQEPLSFQETKNSVFTVQKVGLYLRENSYLKRVVKESL